MIFGYPTPPPQGERVLYVKGMRLAWRADNGNLIEMSDVMIHANLIHTADGDCVPEYTQYTGKKITIL